MNRQHLWAMLVLGILFSSFSLSAQTYQCGHDHPIHKEFLERTSSKRAPAPQSGSRSAVCKRVRVYWIVPNGADDNTDRRRYAEIATREVQQQWASQGRTAYFENMTNLYTSYTMQDFVAEGGDNWFSFAIDNVVIPLVGPNDYNSRTLLFVDGDYSTCCAWGAGGSAGWAGMPNWTISGIENYVSNNIYDSRSDIGAIAHELGHAFDMPHEDGHSDNGSVNCDEQCAPKGIMCNGGSPSPCGEYKGYPSVSINGWNNNFFGRYPEYFKELGGTCNGPDYVWATGGNSQVTPGQEYFIRSKGSNKVLTAVDGNIVQQDYTGDPNQHWQVGPESFGLNTPEKIRFQQILNVGTGQAIDNYAYNMDPGGNIAAWANTNQNNQYWRIINRGGGDYAIQSLTSGRVMDVQGGSTDENANIQQWEWNGTNAQLWQFEEASICLNQGGDTDGDRICDNVDSCPTLDNSLLGTACDDNNPGTTNDKWLPDCTCKGTPACTKGRPCDGEYGPDTGTYDKDCNCITAPCNDRLKYAGNCDLDGDGILNGEDDDDDNDGIPDLVECPVSNVITNSSFDGTLGGTIPTGWEDYSATLKTVTNNMTKGAGPAYPPNVTPQSSADGGTWAGTYSVESISGGLVQQVNLLAGNTYAISFEQANFGIDLSSSGLEGAVTTGSPGQYELLIDAGTDVPTTSVAVSPIASLGPQWTTVTMSYTPATSGIYTLALVNKYLGTTSPGGSYLSVDNFQMAASNANDCDDDNDNIPNQFDNDATVPVPANTKIQARVLLEGFYDGNNGLTKTTAHANLLPKRQPFNTAPWNYTGNESVATMPANVVDWVLVVTRNAAGAVQEQKTGFLTTTGELLDVDGTMGLSFDDASTYFSIHHKSHLAVMSATPYTDGVYDFTTAATQAMGNEQLKEMNGKYVLHCGDYDGNGNINAADFNLWNANSAVINQYMFIDGDGNGVINATDYNLWVKNKSKLGHPPLQYN